jgi:hypothetical protein
VSLVKCNGCDQRNEDKYTSTTFAWRRADGVRVAHRARLCVGCFAAKVAPVDRDYVGVDRLTCPNCGIETEEDMDAIYFTCYIPRYGEHKIEAPFCAACAASYRVWVLEHSWELEDQRGATGGPSIHPSAEEVLRAMGIEPRAS